MTFVWVAKCQTWKLLSTKKISGRSYGRAKVGKSATAIDVVLPGILDVIRRYSTVLCISGGTVWYYAIFRFSVVHPHLLKLRGGVLYYYCTYTLLCSYTASLAIVNWLYVSVVPHCTSVPMYIQDNIGKSSLYYILNTHTTGVRGCLQKYLRERASAKATSDCRTLPFKLEIK